MYESMLMKYKLWKSDQWRKPIFCAELREITYPTESTIRNNTISIRWVFKLFVCKDGPRSVFLNGSLRLLKTPTVQRYWFKLTMIKDE